jgi:hypothetical protein
MLSSAPAAQQATLLELLDAPQLMDTCVRNGIYDEALDLHAFIMRVALLHPNLPIVKLLAAQVNRMWRSSAPAAAHMRLMTWVTLQSRRCLAWFAVQHARGCL